MIFSRPVNRALTKFRPHTFRRYASTQLSLKPGVYFATQGTSIKEASALLTEKNIGCLIIAEEGKCVGLITERDILKAVGEAGDAYNPQTPVEHFMTPAHKLKTLTLDDNLAQSIDEMERYNIRHIPILQGDTIVAVESIRGIMGKVLVLL